MSTIRMLLAILFFICNCSYLLGQSSATITSADDTSSEGSDIPTFTLSNGITIPLVGLGSASGVKYPHVKSAIELGYRFVDTAQSSSWGYREEDVGRAVSEANKRYEDSGGGNDDDYVFVQTKIHPQDLGYHSTKKAIERSLQKLQVSSLDSVLLHKPRCWEGVCSREPEGTWHDSWRALEEAVDAGLVRSIGICDVDNQILNQLLKKRIRPTMIQNWFDPFHQDTRLRNRIAHYNEDNPTRKILYQGYSTLGTQWHHFKGYVENPVLKHGRLQSIAAHHDASIPQVVIQWAVRRGVMVLPASTKQDHQLSNLESFSFTLDEKEMRAIDDLDGKPPSDGKKKEVDPNEVQVTFTNKNEGPVDVYWVPEGGGKRDIVQVGKLTSLGDTVQLTSYHGHAFVFREGRLGGDASKQLHRHVIDRTLGPEQNHDVGDRSEEL